MSLAQHDRTLGTIALSVSELVDEIEAVEHGWEVSADRLRRVSRRLAELAETRAVSERGPRLRLVR